MIIIITYNIHVIYSLEPTIVLQFLNKLFTLKCGFEVEWGDRGGANHSGRQSNNHAVNEAMNLSNSFYNFTCVV